MKLVISAASAVLLASAAQATTVYNTDLPQVNGTFGLGTAFTVTSPAGTLTTVVGPGGSANRAGAPAVPATWEQENVGGNAAVGITTTFARSGNGSAFFQGVTPNDSKADLEYYFNSVVPLSSVSSMSYDWYRSSASTNAANQVSSLRLALTNSNFSAFTYLIYEPVYNGVAVAPTDSWQTSSITGASTFWSNNGNLARPAGVAACPDCFASLSDWQAANPTWFVYGLSTGIGSGWSGAYTGAVDNIGYNFGNYGSNSFNFEVAAGVPEPATWGLMLLGFGLIGAATRRRKSDVALA